MLRTLDKNQVLRVLQQRPALVKKFLNPTSELLLECINNNSECAQFLTDEQKNLDLLTQLINKCLAVIKKKGIDSYITIPLGAFSEAVRNSVPEALIVKLVDCKPSFVTFFSNAPYELYLKYASQSQNLRYNEVPEKYLTEKVILTILKGYHAGTVPNEKFTDSIVDKLIDREPERITYVPVNLLTLERVKRALTNAQSKLKNIKFSGITFPKEKWDAELAELVIENNPNDLREIPSHLITRDMVLKGVEVNGSLLYYASESIPKEFIDEEVCIIAMTGQDTAYGNLPEEFQTTEFLLKLAAKDQELNKDRPYGVYNYHIHIKNLTSEQWVEVLKVCPKALQYISKEHQSQEVVNAFFENATVDLITTLANRGQINLTRVKKDHVPFLIGTNNDKLQEIIRRKSCPAHRVRKSTATQTLLQPVADGITVYMTDSELTELQGRYTVKEVTGGETNSEG